MSVVSLCVDTSILLNLSTVLKCEHKACDAIIVAQIVEPFNCIKRMIVMPLYLDTLGLLNLSTLSKYERMFVMRLYLSKLLLNLSTIILAQNG